jgi:hypothetical protein
VEIASAPSGLANDRPLPISNQQSAIQQLVQQPGDAQVVDVLVPKSWLLK